MNLFVRKTILRRIVCISILCLFFLNVTIPPTYAQGVFLPQPGKPIPLSPQYTSSLMQGLKIYPDNPLRLDFIISQGQNYEDRSSIIDDRNSEAKRLIKYFLTTLTIPEKDAWVNLSPYEKDRIIPDDFSKTAMGRDLLAQDYLLKQITSSLMYPESKTGKKFWKKIYQQAYKKYGTTEIPTDSFNKVWIVPDKAVVYENADSGTAYVVQSRLKVMLEEDYLSRSRVSGLRSQEKSLKPETLNLTTAIIRQIIIPELEQEVNQGENFAQLRQVYHSLILATWFKRKLKNNILNQIYSDKNKTKGIDIANKQMKETIYAQYLEAFKKGAYNYIKEEYDPLKKEIVPRKYFSGGMNLAQNLHIEITHAPDFAITPPKDSQIYKVRLDPAPTDKVMTKLIKSVPMPQTTQQIIDSLGNLEAQDAYQWQNEPSLNGQIAKNPIQLSKQGKDFFNELFHRFKVSKDAELVLLKTQTQKEGKNISPLGIMLNVVGSNQPIFFNLTPLTLYASGLKIFETSLARESLKFLNNPEAKGQKTYILNLLSQETDFPNPEIQELLSKKFGMDQPFKILTIENDNIFHATGAFSKDFQQAVCTKNDIFKNKSVHETGVGTGINLLYAIKFGAKSVQGTDISLAHTLLTEWNLRYAMETNQISSLNQKNIKIVHGNGFADLPNADVYLFNTPAIMPKETIEERIRAHLTDLLSGVNNLTDNIDVFKNVFIGTDQFSRLFSELKARLKNSKAQAIWRIRIYNYLAQKELQIPITQIIANKNLDQAYLERASNFFKYQNLAFNRIESPREFEIPDIFSFRYNPASVQPQNTKMIFDHYDNAMTAQANLLTQIAAQTKQELIDQLYALTGNNRSLTSFILGYSAVTGIENFIGNQTSTDTKTLFGINSTAPMRRTLRKQINQIKQTAIKEKIYNSVPNEVEKQTALTALKFYQWNQTRSVNVLMPNRSREYARQHFEKLGIETKNAFKQYEKNKKAYLNHIILKTLKMTNGNVQLAGRLLNFDLANYLNNNNIHFSKEDLLDIPENLELKINEFKSLQLEEKKMVVRKLLSITNGNLADVAHILDIKSGSINYFVKIKLGIDPDMYRIQKNKALDSAVNDWTAEIKSYEISQIQETILSLVQKYGQDFQKFLAPELLEKIYQQDQKTFQKIAFLIKEKIIQNTLHKMQKNILLPVFIRLFAELTSKRLLSHEEFIKSENILRRLLTGLKFQEKNLPKNFLFLMQLEGIITRKNDKLSIGDLTTISQITDYLTENYRYQRSGIINYAYIQGLITYIEKNLLPREFQALGAQADNLNSTMATQDMTWEESAQKEGHELTAPDNAMTTAKSIATLPVVDQDDLDYIIDTAWKLSSFLVQGNILSQTGQKAEFVLIQWALYVTKGNNELAAQILNIPLINFNRRLVRYRNSMAAFFIEKDTGKQENAPFDENWTLAKHKFKTLYIRKIFFSSDQDFDVIMQLLQVSRSTIYNAIRTKSTKANYEYQDFLTKLPAMPLKAAEKHFEKYLIEQALSDFGYINKTAESLHISVSELSKKIKEHDLEKFYERAKIKLNYRENLLIDFPEIQDSQEKFEKILLLQTLSIHTWNFIQTAEQIGISDNTIHKRLKNFGLKRRPSKKEIQTFHLELPFKEELRTIKKAVSLGGLTLNAGNIARAGQTLHIGNNKNTARSAFLAIGVTKEDIERIKEKTYYKHTRDLKSDRILSAINYLKNLYPNSEFLRSLADKSKDLLEKDSPLYEKIAEEIARQEVNKIIRQHTPGKRSTMATGNASDKTPKDSVDFSMLNNQNLNQNEFKKGGIDFNGNNLGIETKGESIDFTLPDIDLEKLKNMDFDGFTPVILEVVPLTSLPMFLGLNKNKETGDPRVELSKAIH